MTDYRRRVFEHQSPNPSTNRSLWLDKYFSTTAYGTEEPKQAFVQEIVKNYDIASYKKFFENWKAALEEFGARIQPAKVINRLAISMGEDNTLETSIALHHTYGVPFIPASALKGLASNFASKNLGNEWKKESVAYNAVFGSQEDAGFVTFFDALYIPGSTAEDRMLIPDVITVHHADYYQGAAPPADWDGTVVIPTLTAVGTYLLALSGPEEWVEQAYKIVKLALELEGVGAKTNSDYGRMVFCEDVGPAETYDVRKRRLLAERPAGGRERGVIQAVLNEGKFGFITPTTGGNNLFIHKTFLEQPGKDLIEGQVVEFVRVLSNGKLQAQQARILLNPD